MEILTITQLSKEQEVLATRNLLTKLLRWQLNEFLRDHDIPNRTKIFKGLNWVITSWNNSEDYKKKAESREKEHLKYTLEILEFVTLKDVIAHYLKYSNVDSMMDLISEPNIGARIEITFKVQNYRQEQQEAQDDGRLF